MKRGAAIAAWLLCTVVLLPASVAAAQEESAAQEEPEPTTPENAEPDGSRPPAVRIESVDVGAHPQVQITTSVTTGAGGELPPEAFTVLEDGVPRTSTVTFADRSDLQVLLLIDTTGSMGGPPMAAAKSAASTFVAAMPDDVQLAVLGYDATVTTVTDFTSTRDGHLQGIDGLEADGVTAMYDAVLSATDAFADDDAARVIVLLTDGEDNASAGSLDDALQSLVAGDVTLHSVEYLTAYNEGQGIRAMANGTGGAVLRAEDADALTAVYEQLAADLVSRYVISYTSESHGRTDLDVQVDSGGLQARARRTISLPQPAATVPDEPDDPDAAEATVPPPDDPPTIPPTEPSWLAQEGVVLGAALYFLAFAIAGLLFLAPRERRAQLIDMASTSGRRRNGMTALADRASLLADRGLERRGYRGGLNAALERAGIDLRPGEFVVLVGCITLTAAATGRLLHGWVVGAILAVAAMVVCRLGLSYLAERRQARFADQLGETLQLLSGSLRAGYSLMQAVDSVAREADAPAAEEFARLVVETRLGRSMHDALEAMSDRMQSEDFSWIMQAIQIHREVGGDLAEVLDNVAATIRERNQIRRQVKALSAEGRLSAYVLISLPVGVGIFIALTNPSYLAELPNGGLLGWGMMALGSLLMLVGIVWMRTLVKFRF